MVMMLESVRNFLCVLVVVCVVVLLLFVDSVEDIKVKGGDGLFDVCVYWVGVVLVLIVVFFYGGGWVVGDLDMYDC